MSNDTDYLPRWTKRAFIKGSGRDPLGLSRVSDNFTELLLPSIITTTSRARYYSFYLWAIRNAAIAVEKRGGVFEDVLQSYEAAFAIASHLGKQSELSVVGIDQVLKYLNGVSAEGLVNVAFRVLPSNTMGGFGQYYGGCLQTLWLVQRDESEEWKVTEKRGTKLADAFASSVSGSVYIHGDYAGIEELPLDVLRKSSAIFSLDGIRSNGSQAEREMLTSIFFDLDEDAGSVGSDYRQATLGQFLHVLEACEAIESPPARCDVGGSCIFWPHYYGALYGKDEKSVPYVAHPVFSDAGMYWRQFCAHQFFTFATEQLLQAVLDAVSASPEGLSRTELVGELISTEFVEELETVIGSPLPGPAQLVRFFMNAGSPEDVQREFSVDHDLAEWWIYDGGSERPLVTRLAQAFGILSQLYAKWRHSDDVALQIVQARADEEWCLSTCFDWGDLWCESEPDWNIALSNLVDEVFTRHELVKFRKGRLDAAWLELVDGHFTKLQDLTPDFRSNRHPNVATIFQDLCLLEDGGIYEPLQLTVFGKETLRRVIQNRTH